MIPRREPDRAGEDGSAAVVAVGVVAGTILVTAAVLAGCGGVAGHQRAVAAADAAALAAADVASGLLPGEPCGAAERVAGAMTATIAGCAVEGGVATVEVVVSVGPLVLPARSRAGPPP
ncbi:secretion/DNA translocation related TadE-like protein [Rathayibacter sp. PhB151]|uniref:Rv3654c family TadE-like protein n=1 Tax=Rathayibacter sp. PhB151 TaxID=2485189 RepID=UPI0010D2D7FD|nr:Rv3654c family TadE-like protein [Rathayibacter sp. PhB151]TDX75937.1 secretion/DNA translocation related TadE-like protein [Rathayibacter sp. PhB151]